MKEVDLRFRIRIFSWALALTLAFTQALEHRNSMQSDGVSYLDMGDAIVRGDAGMAANAYWSPLYPLIQGVVLRILHPTAYWQFTVVHLVNFAVFLLALVSFDILWQSLCPLPTDDLVSPPRLATWRRMSLFALGYATFASVMLGMVSMERVTPDMLMSVFVFLALSLLIRVSQSPRTVRLSLMLGATLGLGYLAKAVMFPLSLLLFGLSLFAVRGNLRIKKLLLAELLAFSIIAGPYIFEISKAKGRFTFGDSGRINYMMAVNGVSPPGYFQNPGTATGRFIHNVRKVFDSPVVYEFASPVRGTLPLWNDPSYWADGIGPRLNVKRQLAVLWSNVKVYARYCSRGQMVMLACSLIVIAAGRPKFVRRHLRASVPPFVLALSALAVYALVFVEPRYVAVFFVIMWVAIYARFFHAITFRREALVAVCCAVAAVGAWSQPLAVIGRSLHELKSVSRNADYDFAVELRKLGIASGSAVARVGGSVETGWARLAHLSVIAAVPESEANRFYQADPEVQSAIAQKLRRLGAEALIAEQISPADQVNLLPAQWQRIGSGRLCVLKLRSAAEEFHPEVAERSADKTFGTLLSR